MLGNCSYYCCHPLTFFIINFFINSFILTLSQCQTVRMQIRTNILSVLIWAQTVCKDDQQTTKLLLARKRLSQKYYTVNVLRIQTLTPHYSHLKTFSLTFLTHKMLIIMANSVDQDQNVPFRADRAVN